MRVLIVGEAAGLGRALAVRAAAASFEVRFAGDAPSAAAAVDGVESLPHYPVRAFDEDPSALDALVVLPQDAQGGWRLDLARGLAASVGGGNRWPRLVYWGPHRVYGAARQPPYAPWSEDAELVDRGRWSPWGEADETLTAAGGRNLFLFRAVPVVAATDSGGWLNGLRDLPVVPAPAHDVPVQLLHFDDALSILWRAVTGGHPGVYNASADGLMLTRQLARCLGRSILPAPRAAAAALLAPGRVVGRPALLRDALETTYDGVVIDNARLKTHFGYRPRRSVREALAAALGRAVSDGSARPDSR